MLFPNRESVTVLMSSVVPFRCFSRRFTFARLSNPHMTQSMSRLLTMTFITMAFDHSNSWQFETSPYRAVSKGAHLHLSYSMTLARLLDTSPHGTVLEPLGSHGSCHSKRAEALSATTEQFLLLPVDHTDHGVNGLSPSLHGHYPASSLLRDSPSLSSAFVLLPSWFVHLWRLR
jgi:hypothetical protein